MICPHCQHPLATRVGRKRKLTDAQIAEIRALRSRAFGRTGAPASWQAIADRLGVSPGCVRKSLMRTL